MDPPALDDLRQALWPPHRQVYWQVRAAGHDEEARQLLHQVKLTALETALEQGFNVVMADTHPTREVFERELAIIDRFGITIEWKLFDLPWEVLLARNNARGQRDAFHQQPEAVLRMAFDAFRASDAWWRSIPAQQIELIPQMPRQT